MSKTVAQLLQEYRNHTPPTHSQKITFVGDLIGDIYNITSPFVFNGETIMAGRVEPRDSELSSVMFFRNNDDRCTLIKDDSQFKNHQDPCCCVIGDELILGGVVYPVQRSDGTTTYQMVFYRGTSLSTLTPFFKGPEGMKDIRICGLPNGRVLVMTRPQGGESGMGEIGYHIFDDLDSINADVIQTATLFKDQFVSGEWGGANQLFVLNDTTVGVLGHISYFEMVNEVNVRHYYPMVFEFDLITQKTTPPRIIAERSCFPVGPAKRPDLIDVVFSGGMVRTGDGAAILYAGLSDTEAGFCHLPDPFPLHTISSVNRSRMPMHR